MRHIKSVCTSIMLLACLYACPPLLAGPLDRMDTGPRVNPATNSMLRVPGVVGMDYQSALATLEQAGLNPRVHMLHKQNRQYAGQEGTVVKQLPVAGGMAMLGSSVSISVYAPGNGQGPGNGPSDQGAPPYDQGNGGANTGAMPGQEGPAAGGNGTGSPDNGGFVPPAGLGGGWQGPSSAAPSNEPASPTETPVMHPIKIKHPVIPEKKKIPVVHVPVKKLKLPVKKPVLHPITIKHPVIPEKEKVPVAHIPVKKLKLPVKKPVLRPITIKHPVIPEKKKTPVVYVPVKRPGTPLHRVDKTPSAANPPVGPEREKAPVAHIPVKKVRKHTAIPAKKKSRKHPVTPVKKPYASAVVGKGKTSKLIDWGHLTTGGDGQPSVPKKSEGHSMLLGSHQGGF